MNGSETVGGPAWGIAAMQRRIRSRQVFFGYARFSGGAVVLARVCGRSTQSGLASWPSVWRQLNILGHTRNQKSFLKVCAPTPFDDGLDLLKGRDSG